MRVTSIFRIITLVSALAAAEPIPDPLTAIPSDSASSVGALTAPILDSVPRPAYLAPAVEILGANLAMSAYNRYVRDVDYARIDPETIWHNLANEWVWDDNNFQVNQIGHPLQGGMYYSIARANGHGYLGGLVYTTLGSIQWEYFMETEPPALNDLVTTRMGGAMVGEVSWRLAEYISGETTGKPSNWLRKSGAFLVNPIFGFDRLLNGAHRPTTNTGSSKLMGLRISTGRTVGKGLTHTKGAVELPTEQVPLASTNIRLVYGDPFETKHAFDHFSLNLGLSVLTSPVANLSLRGQLWKFDVTETPTSRHILQLAQNFDYLDGSIYRLSANSMGVEWLSEVRLGGWKFLARAQPVFIALGAASTEYYLKIERDYNLGFGGGWKTAFSARKPGFGLVTAFSDRYWIHTQSGAAGDEIIDIHSIEIQKDIYKGIGLGASYQIYNRSGHYTKYPNVSILNQEFRALATFML